MLNITTMPKEVLGELIAYLGDHESFCSAQTQFAGDLTVEEIRAALRELAIEIRREAAAETTNAEDFFCRKTISKKSKEVLSCLSTYEEKKLLMAFGLTDGSK